MVCGKLCWTANSTLRKFHTVNNWYKFLRARGKLVPKRHIIRTNILHFVKNTHEVKFHIAYMLIPHIGKMLPKFAAFCIRFQFFTVLSLSSVTIKYQFFICVIIWYQVFTCVWIWYQFFTRVSFDTDFNIWCFDTNFTQMWGFGTNSHTCEDLVRIFHIFENSVPILHIELVFSHVLNYTNVKFDHRFYTPKTTEINRT